MSKSFSSIGNIFFGILSWAIFRSFSQCLGELIVLSMQFVDVLIHFIDVFS